MTGSESAIPGGALAGKAGGQATITAAPSSRPSSASMRTGQRYCSRWRRRWLPQYAPGAPVAMQNEAIRRHAGYLSQTGFGAIAKFQGRAALDRLRGEPRERMAEFGAAALVSRWRGAPRRRDRLICAGRGRKPSGASRSAAYTEIIGRLIESQAAGTTQQASATAAMEAAAGLLSRAFASATVDAPDDIAEALAPRCLALIGRDLVRVGESLHVIRMMGGRIRLVPSSTWYWEGDADPATWLCTATAYGPSGSTTWRVPMEAVIFAAWEVRPHGPTTDSAGRVGGGDRAPERERRALPGERGRRTGGGALAGAGRAGLGKRRRRRRSAGGAAEGHRRRQGAGRSWSSRPPAATAKAVRTRRPAIGIRAICIRRRPSRWSSWPMPRSAGCWQRAAHRRRSSTTRPARPRERRSASTHLGVVLPMARMLERELSDKFGEPVRLRFDQYNQTWPAGRRPSETRCRWSCGQRGVGDGRAARGRCLSSPAPIATGGGSPRLGDAPGAARFSSAVPARAAHTRDLPAGTRQRPDRPLQDAVPRPCSRCGREFRPTPRRCMLCSRCYGEAGDGVTQHQLRMP